MAVVGVVTTKTVAHTGQARASRGIVSFHTRTAAIDGADETVTISAGSAGGSALRVSSEWATAGSIDENLSD